MNVLGDLPAGAARLSKASLAAGFAILLAIEPTSTGMAEDDTHPEGARTAEQRLLGSDDDKARFAALQPFTREIAVEGTFEASFDASLANAGVPAVTTLEARRALGTAIDLGREVAAGDRFYLRYEQTFTAEGLAIGVSHVLWAELVIRAKGPFAIHRFRPPGGAERFWLANGEAATAPSMRLPLDAITVSSSFGMRADPFDQPPLPGALGKRAPMGGPEQPTGGVSGKGSAINAATRLGIAMGLAPQPGSRRRRVGFTRCSCMRALTSRRRPAALICAASDGIVVGATANGGYGNWIRIDHPRKLSRI